MATMLEPGTKSGMGDAERLDFIVSMTNLTWPAVAAITSNFQTLTGVGMRTVQQLNASFSTSQARLLAAGGISGIALGDMVVKASEFNREMALTKGLIGDISSRDMAQLSATAKRVAVDFGEAPAEIARGFQMVARAGISNSSDQIKVLTNGMRLAKVEGYAVEDAIKDVITATTLFGDSYSNVERYASAIAHAANVSVTSAPQIAQALKYVGGAAKEHWSIEETLAAIATLSQKGVEGSTAGIAIRSFMIYILREMPKSQKALKELGLSFDDFWIKAGNGSRIRLKPLQDIIKMMSEASMARGYGRGDLMRLLAQFGEPRMMQQYIKLFPDDNELKNGTWLFAQFNDEMQKTYDMQERLSSVLNSTQEKWKQFTAGVQTMEISIGEGLLPTVSTVLDFGKGLAVAIGNSKVASAGLNVMLLTLAGSATILAASWAKGAVFHLMDSSINTVKNSLGGLIGKMQTVNRVAKESTFMTWAKEAERIRAKGGSVGGLFNGEDKLAGPKNVQEFYSQNNMRLTEGLFAHETEAIAEKVAKLGDKNAFVPGQSLESVYGSIKASEKGGIGSTIGELQKQININNNTMRRNSSLVEKAMEYNEKNQWLVSRDKNADKVFGNEEKLMRLTGATNLSELPEKFATVKKDPNFQKKVNEEGASSLVKAYDNILNYKGISTGEKEVQTFLNNRALMAERKPQIETTKSLLEGQEREMSNLLKELSGEAGKFKPGSVNPKMVDELRQQLQYKIFKDQAKITKTSRDIGLSDKTLQALYSSEQFWNGGFPAKEIETFGKNGEKKTVLKYLNIPAEIEREAGGKINDIRFGNMQKTAQHQMGLIQQLQDLETAVTKNPAFKYGWKNKLTDYMNKWGTIGDRFPVANSLSLGNMGNVAVKGSRVAKENFDAKKKATMDNFRGFLFPNLGNLGESLTKKGKTDLEIIDNLNKSIGAEEERFSGLKSLSADFYNVKNAKLSELKSKLSSVEEKKTSLSEKAEALKKNIVSNRKVEAPLTNLELAHNFNNSVGKMALEFKNSDEVQEMLKNGEIKPHEINRIFPQAQKWAPKISEFSTLKKYTEESRKRSNYPVANRYHYLMDKVDFLNDFKENTADFWLTSNEMSESGNIEAQVREWADTKYSHAGLKMQLEKNAKRIEEMKSREKIRTAKEIEKYKNDPEVQEDLKKALALSLDNLDDTHKVWDINSKQRDEEMQEGFIKSAVQSFTKNRDSYKNKNRDELLEMAGNRPFYDKYYNWNLPEGKWDKKQFGSLDEAIEDAQKRSWVPSTVFDMRNKIQKKARDMLKENEIRATKYKRAQKSIPRDRTRLNTEIPSKIKRLDKEGTSLKSQINVLEGKTPKENEKDLKESSERLKGLKKTLQSARDDYDEQQKGMKSPLAKSDLSFKDIPLLLKLKTDEMIKSLLTSEKVFDTFGKRLSPELRKKTGLGLFKEGASDEILKSWMDSYSPEKNFEKVSTKIKESTNRFIRQHKRLDSLINGQWNKLVKLWGQYETYDQDPKTGLRYKVQHKVVQPIRELGNNKTYQNLKHQANLFLYGTPDTLITAPTRSAYYKGAPGLGDRILQGKLHEIFPMFGGEFRSSIKEKAGEKFTSVRKGLGGFRDAALEGLIQNEERRNMAKNFMSLTFLEDFKKNILGINKGFLESIPIVGTFSKAMGISLGALPLLGTALIGLAGIIGASLVWWGRWNQQMEIANKKIEQYKKRAQNLEQKEDQDLSKLKTTKKGSKEYEALQQDLKDTRGSLAVVYDRMAGTNKQIYGLRASNPQYWPMFREQAGPQWYGGGPLDKVTRAFSPGRWASGENVARLFGVNRPTKNGWMTGAREQMLAEAYGVEKQRSIRDKSLDDSQKSQEAMLDRQFKKGIIKKPEYEKRKQEMLTEYGSKKTKVNREFDRQLAPIVGPQNVEAVKRLYQVEEKMKTSQMLLANAITKLIGAVFALTEALLIPLRLFGIGPDVYSPTQEEGQQPGAENISRSIQSMADEMARTIAKIDEFKNSVNAHANNLLYATYKMTYTLDFIGSLISYVTHPGSWLKGIPNPFAESKETWEQKNRLGLEHRRPWYPEGSTEKRDAEIKKKMESGEYEPTTGLPYRELNAKDAGRIAEARRKEREANVNSFDVTLGMRPPKANGTPQDSLHSSWQDLPIIGGFFQETQNASIPGADLPAKKSETEIGAGNPPEDTSVMGGIRIAGETQSEGDEANPNDTGTLPGTLPSSPEQISTPGAGFGPSKGEKQGGVLSGLFGFLQGGKPPMPPITGNGGINPNGGGMESPIQGPHLPSITGNDGGINPNGGGMGSPIQTGPDMGDVVPSMGAGGVQPSAGVGGAVSTAAQMADMYSPIPVAGPVLEGTNKRLSNPDIPQGMTDIDSGLPDDAVAAGSDQYTQQGGQRSSKKPGSNQKGQQMDTQQEQQLRSQIQRPPQGRYSPSRGPYAGYERPSMFQPVVSAIHKTQEAVETVKQKGKSIADSAYMPQEEQSIEDAIKRAKGEETPLRQIVGATVPLVLALVGGQFLAKSFGTPKEDGKTPGLQDLISNLIEPTQENIKDAIGFLQKHGAKDTIKAAPEKIKDFLFGHKPNKVDEHDFSKPTEGAIPKARRLLGEGWEKVKTSDAAAKIDKALGLNNIVDTIASDLKTAAEKIGLEPMWEDILKGWDIVKNPEALFDKILSKAKGVFNNGQMGDLAKSLGLDKIASWGLKKFDQFGDKIGIPQLRPILINYGKKVQEFIEAGDILPKIYTKVKGKVGTLASKGFEKIESKIPSLLKNNLINNPEGLYGGVKDILLGERNKITLPGGQTVYGPGREGGLIGKGKEKGLELLQQGKKKTGRAIKTIFGNENGAREGLKDYLYGKEYTDIAGEKIRSGGFIDRRKANWEDIKGKGVEGFHDLKDLFEGSGGKLDKFFSMETVQKAKGKVAGAFGEGGKYEKVGNVYKAVKGSPFGQWASKKVGSFQEKAGDFVQDKMGGMGTWLSDKQQRLGAKVAGRSAKWGNKFIHMGRGVDEGLTDLGGGISGVGEGISKKLEGTPLDFLGKSISKGTGKIGDKIASKGGKFAEKWVPFGNKIMDKGGALGGKISGKGFHLDEIMSNAGDIMGDAIKNPGEFLEKGVGKVGGLVKGGAKGGIKGFGKLVQGGVKGAGGIVSKAGGALSGLAQGGGMLATLAEGGGMLGSVAGGLGTVAGAAGGVLSGAGGTLAAGAAAMGPIGWAALGGVAIAGIGALVAPKLGELITGQKAQTSVLKKRDTNSPGILGAIMGVLMKIPILGGILGALGMGGRGNKGRFQSPLKIYKGFSGALPDSSAIVFPQLDPDLFKKKAVETGKAMATTASSGSNLNFQPGSIVIYAQDAKEVKEAVYDAIVDAARTV